jgi:hypothetical protein
MKYESWIICLLFFLGNPSLPSLPKTRSNLEIFQIALPPFPVFLEKLSLNLSRFAEQTQESGFTYFQEFLI